MRETFEATVVHILSLWLLGYVTELEAMQQIAIYANDFAIVLEDNPLKSNPKGR